MMVFTLLFFFVLTTALDISTINVITKKRYMDSGLESTCNTGDSFF